MHETALSTPQAWEVFYLIVGTTAGALTGVQFVVLMLITEAGRGSPSREARGGTPGVEMTPCRSAR
jgi:hypothetical protein